MPDLALLQAILKEKFPDAISMLTAAYNEITMEIAAVHLQRVAQILRDDQALRFDALMDLAVVDYLTFGKDEWVTDKATSTGFDRGVHKKWVFSETLIRPRFTIVYHLLSYALNQRLRLCVSLPDESLILPSVITIWPSANWYEREAFDLFGILFDGHPDLRRILTDYGFIGHPFRKDFPLSGTVEVRYDAETERVIYEPVDITPRTLVPKVIREDNRYFTEDTPPHG